MNTFSNTGIRNATSASSTITAKLMTSDRVDHRRADLAPERRVLLELVGRAQQALLEHAAGLAGPDHRDVQRPEHLGVALERVGEQQPGLDVAGGPAATVSASSLRLGLGLEHVQRPQDRHART